MHACLSRLARPQPVSSSAHCHPPRSVSPRHFFIIPFHVQRSPTRGSSPAQTLLARRAGWIPGVNIDDSYSRGARIPSQLFNEYHRCIFLWRTSSWFHGHHYNYTHYPVLAIAVFQRHRRVKSNFSSIGGDTRLHFAIQHHRQNMPLEQALCCLPPYVRHSRGVYTFRGYRQFDALMKLQLETSPYEAAIFESLLNVGAGDTLRELSLSYAAAGHLHRLFKTSPDTLECLQVDTRPSSYPGTRQSCSSYL